MEVKRDESITYSQSLGRHSEYKYTKIIQNTGGEALTVTTAGGISTFEIPAVAFNLSESVLVFDQTSPAKVELGNRLFRDTPPFSRVELFTRGGQYLMDMTNFAQAYNAFGQRTKPIEDYHGNGGGIVTKRSLNALEILRLFPLVSADNTIAIAKWRIPFSEFYNTVLSLDKTLLFNEVLNLRITWAPSTSHGWEAKTADGSGEANLSQNVAISGLTLNLAQETNQNVVVDLASAVAAGTMPPILMPYCHVYKTTLDSTSHAVSVRLSRGHGVSLERIYTLFGSATEEKKERYINDISETRITSFYSLLDSRRVQEFDIDVKKADYDWTRRKETKNRVVGLDNTNNSNNFAWSDTWCGEMLECAKHRVIGGLDLSVERKYDLYVNLPTAQVVNYYTVAVCQKQLAIGPSGISVV